MLGKTLLATACAAMTMAFAAAQAAARTVNGVKVEVGTARHSGDDDIVGGIKLRGDGTVDDDGIRRHRGGRDADHKVGSDDDDDDRGGRGRPGRGNEVENGDDDDQGGRGRHRRGRDTVEDDDDDDRGGRGRGGHGAPSTDD